MTETSVTRRWLWLIPAGFVVLVIAFIAALPGLVASTTHRAAIEALASSLTGRQVHIGGNLSLDLFPEPQLVAGQITIGGPHNETITAQSLTLDLSLTALLRGQLSASTLTLQSPVIGFPWPLPGGAAAIAPPRWLASLHAQISNGDISVGAVRFTGVNADIFTGADGAASVSGSGTLQDQPVSVSLSLAGLDAAGAAPVSIDAADGPASMHLSGTFNAASALAGTISFSTIAVPALGAYGQPATATATINADPQQIALTQLQVFQANARLAGTATLALGHPALSLTLTGSDLTLPGLDTLAPWTAPAIPIHLTLDADDATLAGAPIGHLAARAELSAAGADITALDATLPGNSVLSLSGTADPAGQVAGHIGLNSHDFPALLSALGTNITAPDAWRQASLAAHLAGSLTSLDFQRITGTLGSGAVTGTALLDRGQSPVRLGGALHFDTLDLTPFASPTLQMPGAALAADFEITADRASFNDVKLNRLLIDASLGDQLIVRRLFASLDHGILAASFTIGGDGDISAARALLSLPSAAPAAALIPVGYQPPPALLAHPLAIGIAAAGPPGALATSATISLGQFDVTAAPVLDLAHLTASGAFTLRHPSAIAAMKLFGVNAGLPWPGAGSLSLRADMLLSPTQIGLPDFVLSFGDLTATGKLMFTGPRHVDADIQAGTLALPPPPADLGQAWAALDGADGQITLSANQILFAGAPILGAATGKITLQPHVDDLSIAAASLAGGSLTADLNATTAPATPPSLQANATLTNADAASFALPAAFPLSLATGTIALHAKLTAAGYNPQTWVATLAGQANLAAKSGSATGFDLAALATALNAVNRTTPLQAATLGGTTPFDTLSVAGAFDHGIYTISNASLQSQNGTANATGSIDVPDQGIAINLALHPNVPNPPNIGLALNGTWTNPTKTPALHEALAWTSTGEVK